MSLMRYIIFYPFTLNINGIAELNSRKYFYTLYCHGYHELASNQRFCRCIVSDSYHSACHLVTGNNLSAPERIVIETSPSRSLTSVIVPRNCFGPWQLRQQNDSTSLTLFCWSTMREIMWNVYKIDHLVDLGVGGKIILKRSLNFCMRMWTEINWLMIWFGGQCL